MRRDIVPRFGPMPLSAVKRGDVEAWARWLELAPSTVANMVRTLSGLFGAAVEDGILARNPCTGARLPKVDTAPIVPPTAEEVAQLAEAAFPWFRVSVLLAAGAGLRQGETTGLTVDRLNLLRRSLRVDRQLVTAIGSALALAPPKTVVEGLAAHLAAHPAGATGLVLQRPDGLPISRNRFGHLWRATAKRAGLPRCATTTCATTTRRCSFRRGSR